MKAIKYLAAAVCAATILAGGINLQAGCGKCEGDKKEHSHKCCEEAKKAGKTCEKCSKKDAKQEEKKETK